MIPSQVPEVVSSSLSSYELTFLKKEIKKLNEVLLEKEEVEYILKCRNASQFGALILTNNRILFIHCGLLFGSRIDSFAFNNISSLSFITSVIRGSISFNAYNKVCLYDQIELKSMTKMQPLLQSKL